ncbi:glycosyltransferase family 2 protein [Histidinibacterium lentulum]|nr:glycosyltransferase family 2 protein [Histidinibacterium lentulum]
MSIRFAAQRPRTALEPLPGSGDLGDTLVAMGALSPGDLARTRTQIQRHRVRLADALHLLNGLSRDLIAEAEAARLGTTAVDPVTERPDPRLMLSWGPERCLADGLLPLRRLGDVTLVATARPEEIDRHLPALERSFGPVRLVTAAEDRLQAAVDRGARRTLSHRAETRVLAEDSSRGWRARRNGTLALSALALGGAAALVAPGALFLSLLLAASAAMALGTGLKLAAALATLRPPPADPARVVAASRPVVTLLVALYREREIARHLLVRLARLDYPRDLLDICLVVEADDALTRETLSTIALPPWVRTIVVPVGTLRTKPRALNYALDFARGEIVGVYDAEDAPAPDQIARVAARFAERGPEVACLQGVLDYYNSHANWMTRCFTLEYAAWFRVVLPGLARLGLVVPLGGTTLFFRRDALERLGGWDAHNVTEDADLGLRLARYGYRTELIDTVTGEEANGRLLPWVRQRSRWLKGYAMTGSVHMRDPRRLWRDLGARRWIGVQILFLGTVLQFTLAPVLWVCWLLFAQPLPQPGLPALTAALGLGLTGLFLTSEAVNLGIAVLGARRAGKARLGWWAPTLLFYFPLATAGMFKGLWELFVRPFYWDKTAHGLLPETAAGTGTAPVLTPPPRRPPHPVAAE